MRAALIILAAATALGAFTGWLTAGGGVKPAAQQEGDWSPLKTDAAAERLASYYDAVMETGHFGERTEIEEENAVASEDAGPPRIRAASILDGEIVVAADAPAGGLAAARIGETLPGGWVVTAATLTSVVVEREEKRLEIPVYPQEDAAGQSG